MSLEVCWDGLRMLSFGLSQFHGHGSWLMCEVALRQSQDTWLVTLRATSHMSQEPWPCNGEDPWLSSKGRTMGVGIAVLCSHMPSSTVWSENGPCCRTIAYFIGGKEGRIWLNIICLKLYPFERIIWWCLSILECLRIFFGICSTICLEICFVGKKY